MPIHWKPRDNRLTLPNSYAAFPVNLHRIDIDELSALISANNPTISAAMVKSCLNLFKKITEEQLSAGNSITLTNFISIFPSISQRLDSTDDRVRSTSLSINATVSRDLIDEIRAVVTFVKEPYIPIKQPEILSAKESLYGVDRWINGGFGLSLYGNNLRHNPDNDEEGIYLSTPAGNTIKQANLSLNENANVIFVAKLDTEEGPAGVASVENELQVRTTYTENGTLRVGRYSGKIRQTNYVGDDVSNSKIFVTGDSIDAPVEVVDYQGDEVLCACVLILDNLGSLFISIGTLQAQGQQIEITGEGEYVLPGLSEDLTIDVVDFNTLIQTVTNYNRYMVEVIILNRINSSSIATISGWEVPTADNGENFTSVIHDGVQYVAISTIGSLMTSSDGLTWDLNTNIPVGAWIDIAYGNGIYVAVAISVGNNVMYSSDLVNWNLVDPGLLAIWHQVEFGDGKFVATSGAAGLPDLIATSVDGVTWVKRTSPIVSAWTNLIYTGSSFIATSYSDNPGYLITSTDGITWSLRESSFLGTLRGLSSISNASSPSGVIIVATPNDGNTCIVSVDNGISWSEETLPISTQWKCVASGNGLFLAISGSGYYSSIDGINWNPVSMPSTGSYVSGCYNSPFFVLVGDGRAVKSIP